MNRTGGRLLKAAAVLLLVPVLALVVYDAVAVGRHVPRIEAALAQARPDEASPPQLVRDLIDADNGSLAPHVSRMAMTWVAPTPHAGMARHHVRSALWAILLPLHLDKSQMYGLYCVRAYNGTDHGLGAFSLREYGLPLSRLSAGQAAATVAIAHAPSAYLRDRDRLNRRVELLLAKSGHLAPAQQ